MLPWRPAIDAETLRRETPIVIMSRGHSGTRLLGRAIEALGVNLGPLHEGTADTQDRVFTRRIKLLAARTLGQDAAESPREGDVRRMARVVSAYIRGLSVVPGSGAAWGWKFPETYLIPSLVNAVFPRAYHVHMVRDGRDLAFKRHLTDDPERRLGRLLLERIGALGQPHHVQAARSWEFQVTRYIEFAERSPARVVTLRFEELCERPVETMERVAAFLERPMTDACRELMERSVVRGKVAQHRQESPVEVQQVEEAIRPTLARLGYVEGGTRRPAPAPGV